MKPHPTKTTKIQSPSCKPLKVGQDFFHCFPYAESAEDEAHMDQDYFDLEVETWRVRSIRGGKVCIIRVVPGLTYGKRSTKHGDVGFLKRIPTFCRRTWSASSERNNLLFYRLHTTKLAALKDALKETNRHYAEELELKKGLQTRLKRLITQARKKK